MNHKATDKREPNYRMQNSNNDNKININFITMYFDPFDCPAIYENELNGVE